LFGLNQQFKTGEPSVCRLFIEDTAEQLIDIDDKEEF
jgi:hypothetical protein